MNQRQTYERALKLVDQLRQEELCYSEISAVLDKAKEIDHDPRPPHGDFVAGCCHHHYPSKFIPFPELNSDTAE